MLRGSGSRRGGEGGEGREERGIGEIGGKNRGVDVGGPGMVRGRGLRVHEGDIEAGWRLGVE